MDAAATHASVRLDWAGSPSITVSNEDGRAVLDVAIENTKETHLVFAVSSLVFGVLGIHLLESLHQHGSLGELGQLLPAVFLTLGGLGGVLRNLHKAFLRERVVLDAEGLEITRRAKLLSPRVARAARSEILAVRVFENGSRIHKKHRAVIYVETRAGARLSLGNGLKEDEAGPLAAALRAALGLH